MYICDCCGMVFEDIAEWRESRGEYWGDPAYETLIGSPCCHEGFTEAVQCKECGEWVSVSDTTDGYCGKCRDNVLKRYRAAIAEFSENDRELLFSIYEGCDPFAA